MVRGVRCVRTTPRAAVDSCQNSLLPFDAFSTSYFFFRYFFLLVLVVVVVGMLIRGQRQQQQQ